MFDAKQQRSIALTVLSRAVDAREARSAAELIGDGLSAEVALVARITAIIKRDAPTEAKPTANLLNKALLGELLRRLGVTREAAIRHMRQIAEESIAHGQVNVGKAFANANPELLMAIKQIEDEVIDKLPKQNKRGPIRVAATLSLDQVRVMPSEGGT